MCGIVDLSDKEYDVILPADVVKELQQIPVVSVVVAECVNADSSTNAAVDVLSDSGQSVSEDTSSLMSGDVTNAEFCNSSAQSDVSTSDDASKWLDEQQHEASLVTARPWLVRVKVILSCRKVCCTVGIMLKVNLYVNCVCRRQDASLS